MEKVDNAGNERGKKSGRLIEVRMIDVIGGTALVEWIRDNVIRRGYVPSEKITGNYLIEETELEKAQPYGDDLKIEFSQVRPEEMENELHKYGIWTVEDVEKNFPMIAGIIVRLAQSSAVDYLKKLKRRYE